MFLVLVLVCLFVCLFVVLYNVMQDALVAHYNRIEEPQFIPHELDIFL